MSYKVHKIYTLHRVKKILLTFCFLVFTLFGWGQSKEFVKKNFKDNIKGYKKAMDSIKKGNSYCAKGMHYFRFAIPYYMSAEKFNPDNAMLNYKIGKCMIYSTQKMKAAKYLEKAIALNPMVIADAHYFLARAYHVNMDWDKAKQEYCKHLRPTKAV
jgi:tetratricopeptide (TPR) repeat protein